ncbi:MAG: TIGR03013 family PEP-CTERM/XrtA system glycosyltransferase [Nitrosomonadales bacterium]|nr:TIGR03013 family PEP-CTERM/XrtA system glycosyltransferase [Nitrosomonadales bacterium]
MIRFVDNINFSSPKFEYFFTSACIFAMVMIFSMSALGMYQNNFKDDIRKVFLRLMPSLALGFGIITLVFYLVPDIYFGRGVLGLVIIVAAFGILLTRYIFLKSFGFSILKSRVILLGASSLAKECSELALNIPRRPYEVVGFVPMQDEKCAVPSSALLPIGESLLYLAKKYNADEIIVAVQNRRNGNINSTGKFNAFVNATSNRKPIDELLECKLAGVNVIDAATFFEREASQIRVDSLQPSWLVFGGGFDQSFLRAYSKRVFDLVASLILLIVSLPIMLVTALCIFAEDGAPIFYQQERVGKDGRGFMVLKFRSMKKNAEVDGKPQWAATDDPRTTRVGRIIRMLRIDELPQILNVFKGDMSFVGPRPERPYFVKQLCEQVSYYNVRHSIKPGITGLAQVRYQYGASVDDAIQKLQYDLYYVKNNSLFLDFLILIDTLQVVLLGKGAR